MAGFEWWIPKFHSMIVVSISGALSGTPGAEHSLRIIVSYLGGHTVTTTRMSERRQGYRVYNYAESS